MLLFLHRNVSPQEPLYLPSNSELDVHIWRLTDPRSRKVSPPFVLNTLLPVDPSSIANRFLIARLRKVWYEWHAEAFLPLPSTHTLSSPSLGAVNSFGHPNPSTPGPRSPQMGFSSPMMDAAQLGGGGAGSSLRDGAESLLGGGGGGGESSMSAGRLKIGQSSLTNPQGRSFSIGL